eukprot:CAMPEP_0178900156 /NCGR_PEP_ID=MMETSP0786-20121207/3316_1 /TAXON_ID=186022 /ORGANISM="Thalassionema frauenfeldii, Strain CCMP 1798" /LENGTH=262 /DNA_ID=CAMNT_0020571127 /DNA_START=143 /DNA_END=931 /DNA_ORIENTATION=-
MKFECIDSSWEGDSGSKTSFKASMQEIGAIAEAFVEGDETTSPSVQAVIEPNNTAGERVVILSTHEQILDGQVYMGCQNPANASYRPDIIQQTMKIGTELATRGVVGHFSVDFLAIKSTLTGESRVYAIEINLRQGGTTHPHANMATLCGGYTSSEDGLFRTRDGSVRCYKAIDNYKDIRLKTVALSDFLNALSTSTLPFIQAVQWDDTTKTGVVFHMLNLLPAGKVGFTCIGKNLDHSNNLYNETTKMLKVIAEEGILKAR